jgi:RNA polymerase sigma-70 factor (ECF subfamily)
MRLRALEHDTDERLLIEAAQSDPSRFAELYEQNFDRVYAYVARRVHNREQAEDLTAEVFHQALANLGRYEWRGLPFAAWLLRIASNALADGWKRAAREQELPPEAEEAGGNSDLERRTMLSTLVDSLPADQRQVIVRRFVDQRSIRDIALELGRSEGAVKQLQFRALQALRARARSNHV